MSKEILHGNVHGFMETGSEGMDWAFTDENQFSIRKLRVDQALDGLVEPTTVYLDLGNPPGIISDIPESVKAAKLEAEQRLKENREGADLFKLLEKNHRAVRRAWRELPNEERKVEVLFPDRTAIWVHPGSLAIRQYGYDALHMLETGDEVAIFDRDDPERVVWEGVVDLQERHWGEGNKIHPAKTMQRGVEFDAWVSMFVPQSPAQLTRTL